MDPHDALTTDAFLSRGERRALAAALAFPRPSTFSVETKAHGAERTPFQAVWTSQPRWPILRVPMWVGDVVAARFVIERPIGSGGMGSVFQAKDRATGGSVAVKVLDLASEGAVERFRREARVLSELSHPGVVRYIADGETETHEPFLVMELLEGEDLAQRLTRTGLSVEESVAVVRRAAEALAFAHANGIVHRDVKPSNLFLVNGEVARLKVLDFGIARTHLQTQGLTQTGAMLGTVGYMAPEQAMGARDVDARADVFALGCVLFECLTGRPAFVGDHVVAVLAKVLTEHAPRVGEIRPGLGVALDSLVAQMLSKSVDARPIDAQAVLGRLNDLGVVDGSVPSNGSRARGLTGSERRVVSMVLAEVTGADTARTITPGDAHEESIRVQELAAKFGGEATFLAGGTLFVVFSGGDGATDLASRAASYALGLRQMQPELHVVLATGWSETTGTFPVGPVIDRAAALLRSVQLADCEGVVVDDVTAGLLGPRFEFVRSDAGNVLARERESELPRFLLGRLTPCVGREKELALLDATLEECTGDRVARAVVVTALAGVGKSRLSSEFVARVRTRDEARVLMARAEAVVAGAGSSLAQRLVRSAAGIRDADATSAQRAALESYLSGLGRHGDLAESAAEFIGEVASVPTDAPPSPLLHAARNDPAVMWEQKRRAFEAWIGAETRTKPLLLVLEDLHFSDVQTAAYFESALRTLRDCPFMVLALGRPEVHEQFPGFLRAGGLQTIRLEGLTRRAAERLVSGALGRDTAPDIVARIVDRADGNAFYLEELIRNVSEGDMDFPETVVAMAQSRLDRLEPDARRVLRAASVFGEVFWVGGVVALIAGSIDVSALVDGLVAREVLVPRTDSKFARETEYGFRHALLRDAAYAMLTDEDRSEGHGLAGEWLERSGEPEPAIVALHFEQGREPSRALPWLVGAGEGALGRAAYHDAVRYFDRALDSLRALQGASVPHEAELRVQVRLGNALLAAEQYGRCGPVFERARELHASVRAGDDRGAMRLTLGLWACSFVRGNLDAAAEFARQALALMDRAKDGPEKVVWAHAVMGNTLLHAGRVAEARHHLRHAMEHYDEARHAADLAEDPGVMAMCWLARTEWLSGRVVEARRIDAQCVALAHRLQKPVALAASLTMSAILSAMMGEGALAGTKASAAIAAAETVGLPLRVAEGRSVLAWSRAAEGSIQEGVELMRGVDEAFRVAEAQRHGSDPLGWALVNVPHVLFQAETYLKAGRHEAGLTVVEKALANLGGWDLERACLKTLEGELLLGSGGKASQGRAEDCFREAIELARVQAARAHELRAALRLYLARSSTSPDDSRSVLRDALEAFPDADATLEVDQARRIIAE